MSRYRPNALWVTRTWNERHRRWSADGTGKAVLEERQIEADTDDPDGDPARQARRRPRS
ncbi:hypothetical protein [Streptomyces scabiei]|uniref:hypothetical protein n=1 Tax=Streptomyces scabiei TaxID=1930 RepID=UPI000A9F9FAC|nr:hypothetical protein [Streptomyces scabiei]MDX2831041.1 hypothetical protein [Streptomyces scabiei]MDX3278656.1 hypothetical protein [Streptomyces scabiei]MDX3676714.1 hypothetical protein [Streptomyces scabiei]